MGDNIVKWVAKISPWLFNSGILSSWLIQTVLIAVSVRSGRTLLDKHVEFE